MLQLAPSRKTNADLSTSLYSSLCDGGRDRDNEDSGLKRQSLGVNRRSNRTGVVRSGVASTMRAAKGWAQAMDN